jgi:hypothetical protein
MHSVEYAGRGNGHFHPWTLEGQEGRGHGTAGYTDYKSQGETREVIIIQDTSKVKEFMAIGDSAGGQEGRVGNQTK